jgi:hypothetical protein
LVIPVTLTSLLDDQPEPVGLYWRRNEENNGDEDQVREAVKAVTLVNMRLMLIVIGMETPVVVILLVLSPSPPNILKATIDTL